MRGYDNELTEYGERKIGTCGRRLYTGVYICDNQSKSAMFVINYTIREQFLPRPSPGRGAVLVDAVCWGSRIY